MPRGVYPRRAMKKTTVLKNGMKVEQSDSGMSRLVPVDDPKEVPPLTKIRKMALEANTRASKLMGLLDLAKEAKLHLSEKEFRKVEQSVYTDFMVAVMDLSTGVANAAAGVDPEMDEEEDF